MTNVTDETVDLLGAVSTYPDLIAQRNQQRGWGLSTRQIDAYAEGLAGKNHTDLLLPIGTTLRLGRGLRYDWTESTFWVRDVLREHDVTFNPAQYINPSRVPCFSGSEPENEEVELSVALLDLQTFWDADNGVVPCQARKQCCPWPGTEVPWFLAMNPGYYLGMNGRDIPFLCATGLGVGSVGVPVFDRSGGEAWVSAIWGDDRWYRFSVVAFRRVL